MTRRLRYLNAMGVDVWVRRPSRSSASIDSPARNSRPTEQAWHFETTQEKQKRSPTLTDVHPSEGVSPRQAWRHMAEGLIPNSPGVESLETVDSGILGERSQSQSSTTSPVPKIHLGLIGNAALCMVFELPEGVMTDQNRQRFTQDVALALGHRLVRFLDFKWPIVRGDKQDQSAPVLRQTLMDQMRSFGKKRLLFGDVPLEYVDLSMQIDAVVTVSIEEIMASSVHKRALWESLRDWRSDINDKETALPGMETEGDDS